MVPSNCWVEEVVPPTKAVASSYQGSPYCSPYRSCSISPGGVSYAGERSSTPNEAGQLFLAPPEGQAASHLKERILKGETNENGFS